MPGLPNPDDKQLEADRQDTLIDRALRQVEDLRARRIVAEEGHRAEAVLRSHRIGAPPVAFPGFRLIREIHRGGQGVVFEAIQESTRRSVAIKVIKAGSFAGATDLRRFDREVGILGALRHPNVVSIHDSGVEAGCLYYVMDYVDGWNLDEYVSGAAFPIADNLELFAKICDAVHAAHLHGVIHRDLKPTNIRIDDSGEPHVLDFGLAKLADDIDGQKNVTTTGQFVGSLPWAAPEQIEGDSSLVDVRTDVYALGVILYQMLTSQFPYVVSGTARDIMDRVRTVEPAPPSSFRSEINDELDTIVLKSLNKDPQRRYQSAGDLGRDVRRLLAGEPIEAKRESRSYLLRKTIARYRYWVGGVAAGVGLVLTFAVITVFQAAQVAGERDRAESEAERARRVQAFLERMFEGIAPENAPQEDFTVRQVLDLGAERVEMELSGMPETAASIHQTLGIAYDGLGLHEDAIRHLDRALSLRQQLYGSDDPERHNVLLHLASAQHNGQKLEAAETTARGALAVSHILFGPGSPPVAESHDLLASILVQMNHWEEAESHAREALRIRRSLYGDAHPAVAASMVTLGTCLRDRGQLDDAEVLMRTGLDVIRRHHGPDATTGVLQQLAELLQHQGHYDEAELRLREVIVLRRHRLGNDHPALAWNLHCLCGLLLELEKNLDEAEAACREALRIQQARLAPDHVDLPQYMHRLARVLVRMRATEEAEQLLLDALRIARMYGQEDEEEVKRLMDDLAVIQN